MTKRRKHPPRPRPEPAPDQVERSPDRRAGTDGHDGHQGRDDGAGALAAARPPGPGGVADARFGAGAGVVFALLSFPSSMLLAVTDVEPTDPAADIAAQFVETRGRVGLGVILTLLSMFFLLVFVSYLYRWLRQAEGDRGWLSTLAFAGGLLVVVTLLMGLLIAFAGTLLEDYGDDPAIARMLLVLGWRSGIIVIVPMAALVGGTAAVAARTGELPRWLSTSGLVLAGSMLVIPVAAIPYLFSTLWIGMVAVTLLTRAGPLFRRRQAPT